ncbi:Rv3235 family protein [Demequina flava]|uniref:Rv3235 family protein n=1 Tax=Demequina flava TaxID=1095025 RepID=UPI000781F7B8|nr:Rv3235 family protein [Demequina flava]
MSAVPVTATPYVRTPARNLGNPAALACTVAKAVTESVLGGSELSAVNRWLEPQLRRRLERQRSLTRRAGRPPVTAHVRRARVERVSNGAAEVALVVDVAGRSRAVAMRLEVVHQRWLTTAIDVL